MISTHAHQLILMICLLAFSATCSHAQDDSKLKKVPADSEIEASLKTVREVYQPKFLATKNRDDRSSLSKEILEIGLATNSDPDRYVLLRLALKIGITAGDCELCESTIESICNEYRVEKLEVEAETIQSISSKIDKDDTDLLVEWCEKVTRQAVKTDRYELAMDISSAIANVAARSRDSELRDHARRIRDGAKQLSRSRDQIEAIIRKIGSGIPTDQDVQQKNLATARFLCFAKLDWKKGLSQLEQCGIEELQQVAAADQKISLKSKGKLKPEEAIKIAGQWWETAEKLKQEKAWTVAEIAAMKSRAAHYYLIAQDELQGLQKVTAESRISEAEQLGEKELNFLVLSSENHSESASAADDVRSESSSHSASLAPVQMANEVDEYELPATFDDVVAAGSGRYLVFLFTGLKKVGLYDVVTGKIKDYIELPNGDVRITADANSIYVAMRQSNTIQKWSLDGLKKGKVAKLPFTVPVDRIISGCSANGPIYVGAAKEGGYFLHPTSLKVVPIRVVDHVYNRDDAKLPGTDSNSRIRVSAKGNVFTFWRTAVSPAGFRTVAIKDSIAHIYYDHDTLGYLAPSPDGTLIHTPKGIYTYETKPYSGAKSNRSQSFSIPALSQNFSIRVPRNDDSKPNAKSKSSVTVHTGGQDQPLVTLNGIRIRQGQYSDFYDRTEITLDRRVYFLPKANLLITLPVHNKSVVRHSVDLEKELEAIGVDYFFVLSTPVTQARSGQGYRYQVEVKSKSGGVKYRLSSGPKGMRVSSSGLLTWRPTRRVSGSKENVILTISDAGGKDIQHTFDIQIQ